MRHQIRGRKLGRTKEHRTAMKRNMAVSILRHHRVTTTHEKALEMRGVVDRLITFAKKGDLHSRRIAARTVQDKEILQKLFAEIGPKFLDREGGYTRVLKLGFRKGDAAAISIIELVGFTQTDENKTTKAKKKVKKVVKKAATKKDEKKSEEPKLEAEVEKSDTIVAEKAEATEKKAKTSAKKTDDSVKEE